MGSVIIGTGAAIPERVVTNHDLTRVIDTSDEWIVSRTGVRQRHFAPPGTGSSDLAAHAVTNAITDAGIEPGDVDALVTATMTPDRYAPGIAGAVQRKAGLGHVGVFDLRQQCAGFLYGLDLADMLLATGRARTVVVVGAETHAGYLPWGDSWQVLLGASDDPITPDQQAINDATRGWTVLFGDAGAAMVLTASPADGGILGSTLHTDGDFDELITVPGLGFARQPFADAAQIAAGLHLPQMDGGGLFRQAVRLMPEAIETVAARIEVKVGDFDLIIAHQANGRIVEAMSRRLDIDADKVPMNMDRYGNTTAATIPLLFHEMRQAGRVSPGGLVAFAAFGAGAHWGAIAYRQPS
ncbi:ketoacyl-ACP synthase III [soil metagenome]